jgi:hypothetical protein
MPLAANPAEDNLSIQPDKSGDFPVRQSFLNPATPLRHTLK